MNEVDRLLDDVALTDNARTRLAGLRAELACLGLAMADLGIALARLENSEGRSLAYLACDTPLEDQLTRHIQGAWTDINDARTKLTDATLKAHGHVR